jgi:hypothetical protein
MLARLSLLALCAALAAAPVHAKEKSKSAEPVSCSGIFGPESSEKELIETFGAENVVTGDVPGPEGMTIFATTVFPDDPARQMEFGWFDEENRTSLSYVELAPSQAGPHGVQIGMSVDEVEAINGAPFNIGGFGWDYGGYAQIEEGNLAGDSNGCFISLRFSPSDEALGDKDITSISGEISVPSSEPLLKEVDTSVQSITLGYPDPNYQEPAAEE